MNRILGIDLGTNSIGLNLRENDEFIWYGVYTFRKGVGEGKAGEFSFAAERTKHRSSRRLYNSRRYRKWETLKVLIEAGFCPLSIEKLNQWKHYKKGIGRVFPVDDSPFQSWIKLDFNGDGVSDYASPYQLRRELIFKKLDLTIPENKYRVGRALYHIAQRRGFKSSRKSGTNEKAAVYKGSHETKTIGRNEYESLIIENGSLGAAFAYLEDQGIRIRNRYTLRSDYQAEIISLLDHQDIIDTNFRENIQKSIFFQRPLRSQKGLIGKCTLEPSKSRCPVSHPRYEEYRAWSFINNIKYRTNSNLHFESLPLPLKEKLYNEKFFLKSKDFEFSQIRKFIKTHGGKDWELNYSHKMDDISVSGCPISARFKSVFGDEWQKFEKTVVRKNKKGGDETITYRIDDVWHILFSFEDEEYFEEFLGTVLDLNGDQIKELKTLFNSFPVGYANLSLKAINNILPLLREGLIYSEAVILAKIPEIIGTDLFAKDKTNILEGIKNVITSTREDKTRTAIVNNLIFKYYALDNTEKFGWKNASYELAESDLNDIVAAAKEHFGERTWAAKCENYKQSLLQYVTQKYQDFFSSSKREHLKPPHLVNAVKQFIADNFKIEAKKLDYIYHPSQIAIYPKKEGQEYLLSPKTSAFRNPMAYKTLYKLRAVINYLIETGKIDEDTRIVVEIARELNDSNKRWAIEKYQRDREVQNRSFAVAIGELLKEKNFKGVVNPNSDTDVDKFRIWTEQLEQYDEIKKEISSIENNKKLSVSEKNIQKYRLWKEQNCHCMYTGRLISLTDLFDVNTIDFEHTIPRSKSFDNSLANLTVCYADYNRSIKNNRLPVELPNYDSESHGYSAIKPRLEAWENRVDELYKQIDFWKMKSTRAIDKSEKDDAIKQKHLRQMDYDYWKNKLDRFTRKEVSTGFVNSQLVDTQIITKYALHYLKTVFDKVDVIKGSITAEFRKIYGIQPKEGIKDRSKHSHHAIDAAVLTLIPSPRKREEVLKKAYEYEEQSKKKQYHEKPFSAFNYSMIEEIQNNILINNLAEKNNVLAPGKKIVRKRGKIVWLNKKKKIFKVATGDSIRGELHMQTYYGKIRMVERNDSGVPLRDNNNNWKFLNGTDEYKYALRIPIEDLSALDKVVDPHLAKMIENQLNGRSLKKAIAEGIFMLDKNGIRVNQIRRIRTWQSVDPLQIKSQTYKSAMNYKNYYYAKNAENYAFAFYKNKDGDNTVVPLNLYQISTFDDQNSICSLKELFEEKVFNKKGIEIPLYHVFIPGQKVLFYETEKEELKTATNLTNHLYFVKRLYQANRGNIQFQHHLEAREDKQLLEDFPEKTFGKKGSNGFSKFSTDFIAPRLLLSPGNFDFIIEGKDFEMKLDGSIEFKY